MRSPVERVATGLVSVLVSGLVVSAAGVPAAGAGGDRADAEAAGPAGPKRDWVGGVGLGSYAAVTGPSRLGLVANAELLGPARVGGRVEARTVGDERGLFLIGLVHEAAAARPRLALSIHGEIGALAPDLQGAAGGGVQTQLWIAGPLAVAVDGTAHVIWDRLDTEIALAGVVSLRIAR